MQTSQRVKPSLFIGIDPGKNGAIAIIGKDSEIIQLEDLPSTGKGKDKQIDPIGLKSLISPHTSDTGNEHIKAVIEQPLSYGMNSYTSLEMGITYGKCLAVLKCLCIEVIEPTAKSWKSASKLTTNSTTTKTDKKNLSVERAKQLFPALKNAKSLRHDRAEALLIANYGRIVYLH